MSSLEFNKIAAAVLTAGVIAMVSGFVADLLTSTPHLEEKAYVIAAAEPDQGGETDSEPAGPESVLPLLASADPAAGETVAKKCTACHSFDKGGANKIGPALWATVSRDIASIEGFAYSSVLNELEGDWDYQALNHFLADPKDYAPGTKMSFAGVKKVKDRADLIVYLRSLADSPVPLPTAEEAQAAEATEETVTDAVAETAEAVGEAISEAAGDTAEAAGETAEAVGETVSEATDAAEEAAESAAETVQQAAGTAVETVQQAATDNSGLGALLAAANPDDGAKVARKCKACHSFNEGGANKIGPNLYDIVGSQIAGHEGFKYSQALQDRAGESWTYQNLFDWLESPKTWAPGNKMTFAGIKKPEDSAALIVYLRSLSGDPEPLPE